MTRHSSLPALSTALCAAAVLALAGCVAESAPAPIDAPTFVNRALAAESAGSARGPTPTPIEIGPRPDAAQAVALLVDLPRWDEDLDGLVDPAEFARGLFAMADRDADERLTAGEFEAARAWLPGEPDPGCIARWDRDADGLLEPRAFVAGVITDQLARGWDRDGDRRLDRPEIAAGLTAAFDADGDGWLDRHERDAIAASGQ